MARDRHRRLAFRHAQLSIDERLGDDLLRIKRGEPPHEPADEFAAACARIAPDVEVRVLEPGATLDV